MPALIEDLRFRGLIYQHSDDALFDVLDHGHLSAYVGFDPTSDSLQIGNLVQLCNLARLQRAGHRPIVLAGGGTGMIGDPGGKSEERPLLTPEELEANLEGIFPQLERFLDFDRKAGRSAAVLHNNAEWLTKIGLIEFLRDVGKSVTINQMASREAVKARLERADQGISYAEFSYMLLQAYDYLHLYDSEGCTLQLGASDQWGSITIGVDLIRRLRAATVFALTCPLVLKADGTKFGKSESGALFLSAKRTSPFELYQYFLRSADEIVGSYLRIFTFITHEEILHFDEATAAHPERREAQRALARSVCTLVHGEEETARVERATTALYSEEIAGLDEATLLGALGDAPHSELSFALLDGGGYDLVAALTACGLASSKSAAQRALAQNGVYVNNRRVAPDEASLSRRHLVAGRYVLLRRGRRDVHLLSFS